MISGFDTDAFAHEPRILFIGLGESTHTHAWIDLLRDERFDVRLFSLPSGEPPALWRVRTYLTNSTRTRGDRSLRHHITPVNRVLYHSKRVWARHAIGNELNYVEHGLRRVIEQWRPDIIHTLGLEPAAYIYHRVRERFGLRGVGRWVLQLRGGSDLELNRFDPQAVASISRVLAGCDQLLSDNKANFEYAAAMGIRPDQVSRIGTVPGTGGVDVDALSSGWTQSPEKRRTILFPKAYDCTWSKALPVFEALKLVWNRISPCRVQMLAMSPEVESWFRTLPDEIKKHCQINQRLPREKALAFMLESRVMLAPSLVDGTPNSMFEAMAAGSLPIVSPLHTITPLVRDKEHVLYARNLYPEEIAAALERAMMDDKLVESAAANNLIRVRQLADRKEVATRVIGFYRALADK